LNRTKALIGTIIVLLMLFSCGITVQANGSLMFSLREHKYFAGGEPDFTFSNPANACKQFSDFDSEGKGWIFVVVPRLFLDGKYLRFYTTLGDQMIIRGYIYDGAYNRSNDSDFPEGSDIPTKGNGLLQTIMNHEGYFGTFLDEVLVDVSGGTQDKCTIFFMMYDAWDMYQGFMQIEWFAINTGSGGSGNLYNETFTDAITMEKTGSYGDYGYISSGEVEWEDSKTLQEQIDGILENTVPALGASGLAMLMFCPFFYIKRRKKKGDLDALTWTFVIAILGFGFVVVWLWG